MRTHRVAFALFVALARCAAPDAEKDDSSNTSVEAGSASGGDSAGSGVIASGGHGGNGSSTAGNAGALSTAGSGGKATGGTADGGDAKAGSSGSAGTGAGGSAGMQPSDSGLVGMALDCGAHGTPNPVLKVACVGDSVTQGVGATTGMSYPSQLGVLLGPGYSVGNFGVSSTTMLKSGDYSYWTHGKLAEAQELSPNVVVIALGVNDVGTGSWSHKAEFSGDYGAMIDLFHGLSTHPAVFAVLQEWFKDDNTTTGYTNARLGEMMPMITQTAQQKGACVIDLYSLTKNHPEYYSDTIHPNDVGYGVIAKAICGAVLTGCPAK